MTDLDDIRLITLISAMKWLLPKRNRTTERLSTARSDVSRWNSADYDKSTGQVYLETCVLLKTHDDRDWARDCRIVNEPDFRHDQEYEDYVKQSEIGSKRLERYQKGLDGLKNSKIRGFKGARSLQDAAMECVLENISDITLEGIECLPISIVRRIWHAVNKRCSMCFNTWSIFATILRQDDPVSLNHLRYHEHIQTPNRRLDVYTKPLTSTSYSFITSLSITTSFPVPDLIKLSSVTNLGVLEIINTQGCENMTVGDRLIRSWHLAALNEGAFSVLRILRLWQHEGLTTKSLDYLSGFPALTVYDVSGCPFRGEERIEVTRLGWKATIDTDIVDLLENACVERAAVMRSNLGIEAGTSKRLDSERLWHGARVRRQPRKDIPKFLAQAPRNTVKTSHSKANPSESKKVHSTFHERRNQAAIQSHLEAWDIPAYRAFARIGELRNDKDLSRAGMEVGDQAIVGSELVNSFPMISLRLGNHPSWFLSPQISTSQGLAFIRIKIPPPDFAAGSKNRDALVPLSQNVADSEPSSTRHIPLKRHVSGIARNKRRKLEDVLASFL